MTSARIALAAVCAVAVLAAAALAAPTDASGANRAGLVVGFPDHTETVWVDFAEPEITGRQLLERSGLDVTFSNFGGLGQAVCRIEDTGCANPNDCFCQCQSGSCAYWGYFSLNNGEWAYQPLGVSKRTLQDGDVDGWAWGAGLPPPEVPVPKPCPTPSLPPNAPPSSPAAPAPNPASGGAQPDPAPPSPGGGAAGSAAGSAVVEATPTPAPTSGGDATAVPAPEASSGAVRRVDRSSGGDGGPQAAAAASSEPDPDDGAPFGLIAFGAVAAAMTAAVGTVVIRRRLRG